jgi:hypothetical protein
MLAHFGRWFASSGGVWQTAVIVMAWWLAEFAGLIHDPQHLQLCVWLTIYSAITQPVLAWVNKQDSGKSDATLARLEAMEDSELKILRGQHE